MPTQTISKTKIEKLKPDTRVGPLVDGNVAFCARVTRYYEQDIDTLVKTEYGIPKIDVLWRQDAATAIAALQAEKASLTSQVNTRIADIDADIAILTGP